MLNMIKDANLERVEVILDAQVAQKCKTGKRLP